jgi:hypothetical protein
VSVLAEAENRSNTGACQTVQRHNKCSIVDSLWPNHDRIQSVTAVKRVCRKLVAVYPLHTPVLGVSQHQLIVQSQMTLV